jgi:hypothetical protein
MPKLWWRNLLLNNDNFFRLVAFFTLRFCFVVSGFVDKIDR